MRAAFSRSGGGGPSAAANCSTVTSRIAAALLRPGFILNKFTPEYNFKDLNQSQELILKPEKEVRVKVTRVTEYGERYKLFVIPKNSFEENYDLEKLGISVTSKDGKFVVDNLKWNGLAKKIGLSLDDQITEFKVENLNRPNKAIVYPFAFLVLFVLKKYTSRSEP